MKKFLVIGITLALLTASSALAVTLHLPNEKEVDLPTKAKAHSATHSQKSQVQSVPTITPLPPPPSFE